MEARLSHVGIPNLKWNDQFCFAPQPFDKSSSYVVFDMPELMSCKVALLHIAWWCLLAQSAYVIPVTSASSDYGIVIDAGSSGSRVRVYAWKSGSWIMDRRAGDLPEIRLVHEKSPRTRLADYVNDSSALAQSLTLLTSEAKQVIPSDQHHQSSIFLFATAGTRV